MQTAVFADQASRKSSQKQKIASFIFRMGYFPSDPDPKPMTSHETRPTGSRQLPFSKHVTAWKAFEELLNSSPVASAPPNPPTHPKRLVDHAKTYLRVR